MRTVAAAVVLLALAVPAAADASTTYVNPSSANGAYVIKSGSTIQQLELYCAGPGFTETSFSNNFDYWMRDVISLGRRGKFSYSGIAYKYGNEHQPQGEVKVKLSGRLTSKAVRIKWRAPECGSGTLTAPRQ